MFRRLSGCAVALALLVPAPLAALSPASAAPSASAEKPGTPIARDVRLGHRPVRYDGDRPSVRLSFTGRKGTTVELATWSSETRSSCLSKTLRRAGGQKVAPWATGYWRLPRTGTYTAVLKPCGKVRARLKVQVRKAVFRDVAIDGVATVVGKNPDVTHLLSVPLAAGERLSIRPTNRPRNLVTPDGNVVDNLADTWLPLEADDPQLRWADGTGTYYLAARPGSTVHVVRALQHAAILDGPATTLSDQGVIREHLVSFTAQAGQWVYAELVDGSGRPVTDGRGTFDLRGPALGAVSGVLTSCPGQPTVAACSYAYAGPWQVAETGTYRLSALVGRTSGSESFALRVRTAAVAPALTIDGPAVTYTATTPGQWVIGPYTEGLRGYDVQATASNASTDLTDWRMTLASGFPATSPGPRTCNGCGDYLSTSLTPQKPSDLAPRDQNAGPSMAVLTVPPGVTGSLEVRLTRR